MYFPLSTIHFQLIMVSLFPSRAIALQIGSFAIHWYGIMYLLAFVACAVLLPRLQKYRGVSLTRDEWLSIISVSVLGVIVGGRLGYVLFYQPTYFFAEPWKILAVWEGGMSFHGGLLGVVASLFYSWKRMHYDLFKIADLVVIPAAIGLALGRFGNFINQELYGISTSLPWGITIPGVAGLHHPTQIYSMLWDLSTSLLCYVYLRSTAKSPRSGRTFALFLMLYGVGRFLVEYLRVQQFALTDLVFITLTRGQLLTVPVFLAGAFLWFWIGKRPSVGK